jgi:hypothetical protein
MNFHKTKIFTNKVSLRYFKTQLEATSKQLQWHDTLAFMDIESIHKLDKYNVMPNVLSHKKEYQREMPWKSIQIFQAMFVI